MTTRKLSQWVIIAATIIIGAYDLWAYLQKDDGTISVAIWLWSDATNVVPLLFGFLMGHFFAAPYPRNEIK